MFGVYSLVVDTGPEARAVSLEGRAGAQGILGPLAAYWWVELSPGLSGRQSHVQRLLGAQEVFNQPVC